MTNLCVDEVAITISNSYIIIRFWVLTQIKLSNLTIMIFIGWDRSYEQKDDNSYRYYLMHSQPKTFLNMYPIKSCKLNIYRLTLKKVASRSDMIGCIKKFYILLLLLKLTTLWNS